MVLLIYYVFEIIKSLLNVLTVEVFWENIKWRYERGIRERGGEKEMEDGKVREDGYVFLGFIVL